MRALILFTLFAGQYAAANCPSFESGTYQCRDIESGTIQSLDLSHTVDSTGKPALEVLVDGKSASAAPLVCVNNSSVTEICTTEQRRSSPQVNATCVKELGRNKLVMALNGKTSPTELSMHVSMSTAPAAGGGKSTPVTDVKVAMRSTGPRSLDISVVVIADGMNEAVRLSCVK